ncbi:hypothetical protein [Rhodoferax sp. GW822-FHT02A01]|uniref:hypothetical protein n=1 Tax=Rhodoferax sp. GW822-FHT02A01 TaxID=3141537 RepID=UPI00315CD977
MKSLSLKRLVVLIFVIVPLTAWFLVKPVRVVAPGLVGISCPQENVCVDDMTRYQEAISLYIEGTAFVASKLMPLRSTPKVIFCSTITCAETFGLGARSAVTVARFGTVVGPRAWKNYYVRHEMIHVLQGEQIGVIPLLLKPSWFVEGMAYSLSEDPRDTLAEPFETDRKLFRSWYQAIGKDFVWSAAKEL